MANTKMFVHYAGTVDAFSKLANRSDYDNKIVFIKGGSDGKGAAIYTHGEYYTSAHDVEALVGSLKAISGVMVNSDKNTLKVAQTHDGVLNFCADGETVAVTMDGPGITISVSEAFRNRVAAVETLADDTAEALGNKTDAADKSGSAFARIANLAALVKDITGGETTSIAGQINAAINALKGNLADGDAATLKAINTELDAIEANLANYILKSDLAAEVSDNDGVKVNVTVKTKDGKVNDVVVDETQLEAALNLKANAVDVYTKTEADAMAQGKVNELANGAVKTNTDAIAVLNGNDTTEGSVDKKIKDALNAFAGSIDDNNTIDNLTELLAYVNGVDGSKNLASAIANIAENTSKIATLNGDATTTGSVDKKVKDAIDTEVGRAEAAYAVKGTEGVASGAAARAEEAYTLAGQKATAAEAKAQAVTAISEIAEATAADSDNTYVKATVTTRAGSVTAVNVDDSGVKTYADSVGEAAKGYSDAKLAEAVGAYATEGVTASGLRKEIEERDAAVKNYADSLFVWEEL